MAAKTQEGDFRNIISSIKREEFANVYILMGEETYYIDEIVSALENSVVPADERDFNLVTVYGQDADMPSLIAACQQYPFMADRKLVILKEAQSIHNAKNQLDNLAEYVLHPSDMNVLVICYKGDNLNAGSKLMKAASKTDAVIFKSPALREYQLDGPIKDYCRARKIGIQEKALVMLKDNLGTSLTKIFGEIDKMIVAGGKNLSQITPELIEKNIGVSKDYNNYELTKALGAKDYGKAMMIIHNFASNPKQNPTVITTAVLFNFYSKLLIGKMIGSNSDSALIEALELKNKYSLPEYKLALSNYSAMQLVKSIHLLREFDAKTKGVESNQNEYELLKELIYNIFTSR